MERKEVIQQISESVGVSCQGNDTYAKENKNRKMYFLVILRKMNQVHQNDRLRLLKTIVKLMKIKKLKRKSLEGAKGQGQKSLSDRIF